MNLERKYRKSTIEEPKRATTRPWIALESIISKAHTGSKPRAKNRIFLDELESISSANSEEKIIPRKAPIKLGLPKVPSMFPYGFSHPTKSPNKITQRQYKILIAPATSSALIMRLKLSNDRNAAADNRIKTRNR